MNILHVIESLDPALGGPPGVAVRIASAQASLGHDVHLVSFEKNAAATRIKQSLERVPGWERIHFHRVSDPGRAEMLLCRKMGNVLDKLVPNADFVHLHGVWEPLLRKAAKDARRKKVPYCVRPAGMLDAWSLKQKPLKKKVALALGYARMLKRAAFIQALNQDEEHFVELLDYSAPALVAPNGVFLEEIDPLPLPGSFAKHIDGLGNKPFILFISRLHYKKGLDYLAAAFELVAKALPDIHLVVAGPEAGAGVAFGRTIEKAGLSDRVHMVGPLYGPDKFAALRDSICFCLPSRQEGFSVAITEALACGVPVVISHACHFPEVAQAGAGEVVELDPRIIADALIKVASNPDVAEKMGHAGRRLVEEAYCWPKVAAQLVEAYTRS